MKPMDRAGLPPILLAKLEALTGDRRTPGEAAIRWRDMDDLRARIGATRVLTSGEATPGLITPALPAGFSTWSPYAGPMTTTSFSVPGLEIADMGSGAAGLGVSIRPDGMNVTYTGAPVGNEWVGWTATLMPVQIRETELMAVRVLLQLYGQGAVQQVSPHTIYWTIHRCG